MTKQEFLAELEEILQREEGCKESDALSEYGEWDSLSKMALMAYYKKHFDLTLSLSDLRDIRLVSDLIKLAGDKIDA